MIPNNKYYKDIAVILGYEWDNKHHSSLVYMKEIAKAYGYSYETTKPSNKFLKDWHTGLTGETPSDHKYNLWYLREIAEFLGSSTGLNENQCLAYIKDNIENPPTEFDSIALTVTTPILSYADGDSTSLSAQLMNGQEEAHLSGKSVSFDVVDSQGTVLSHIGDGVTNANGLAVSDNDYTATGVGDVSITASVGSLVSEIYEVHDYLKYIETASKTFSSTNIEWYKIADLGSSLEDCEISCIINSNSDKGFRLELTESDQYENKNRVCSLVNSSKEKQVIRYDNSGTGDIHYPSSQYVVNTDLLMKIKRQSNQIIATIGDYSYTFSDISNLRYVGFVSWSTTKTLTYKQLIIKPL